MAKFENTQFAKIFDSKEGRLIVSAVLANPDLINANHTWWETQFRVDPNVTPTDAKGRATFISEMRQDEAGYMLDMRAPLGDAVPMEKGNLQFYTGVIPDFTSKAFTETAQERVYKEKLFDQFGDARLIAMYASDTLQPMLDGANQTLSYLSAMLLSTGKGIYDQGEGTQAPIYKVAIPTENFLKAGAVVWSDTTNCRLLDQIRKIYDDVRDHIGRNIRMKLQVTKTVWDSYFLNNAQVIEWVRYFNSLNNVLLPQNLQVTTEMVQVALQSYQGIPEIEIVQAKEKDINNGTVTGWASGKAVLRPVGYAGYIRHTNILDEEIYPKYGNDLISRNYTPALPGGIASIENVVLANGNLKEWQTRLLLSAIPSLDEFLHHFIIDMTSTSSDTF